jgi:iron(III) transport system permease protein
VEGAWLAGGWPAALRSVVWPACAQALGGAALMVFVLALTDFGVASFLGVPVYTAEIMLRFGAFYDVGAGVRSLLPLAALVAGGYLLLRRLTARYDVPPLHVDPQKARRAPLGLWRWPWTMLVALPILLATAAPLLALVSHAPALRDYIVAWDTARTQILNTALYGPLAATLALAMAWPLARAVARGPARAGIAVQTISLGQLAVPGVALGMGLIRLWNRAGPLGWVYGSPLMVIMAGALRGLPLAVLALSFAWRQLPVEIEEAALIAGATAGALRRRVLGPLLRPGIAAAWGLACYRAMTDLEATVLVHAPGDDTLAVRIYTLQHDGQAEHVAALALTLVALTLAAALSVRVLWRAGSDL